MQTDHSARAEELLAQADNYFPDKAAEFRQEAQVHADLAIAQQLRVANLIALASSTDLGSISRKARKALYDAGNVDPEILDPSVEPDIATILEL